MKIAPPPADQPAPTATHGQPPGDVGLNPGPPEASHPQSAEISSKRKYDQTKRKRLYIPAWEKEFDWVWCDDNVMYCKLCRDYPKLNDPRSTLVTRITGDKRHESLVTHSKSANHIKCGQRKVLDEKGDKGTIEQCVEKQIVKLSAEEKHRCAALIDTAFYVAQNKMAFSSFAGLCDLQEKNGVDLESDYRHDKACRDFIQAITIVERQEIVREVKESRFIAVMGDGFTDNRKGTGRSVCQVQYKFIMCCENWLKPSFV